MKPIRTQKGTKHHVSEMNIGNHPKQSTQCTHFDKNEIATLEQIATLEKRECSGLK
jgi:hypothetical protein